VQLLQALDQSLQVPDLVGRVEACGGGGAQGEARLEAPKYLRQGEKTAAETSS